MLSNLLVAWFSINVEGTVWLPAPKSHYTKDIVFEKDTPIFSTGKKTFVKKLHYWWGASDDGYALLCANATRKAKADSSMRKVLRMAFSWQERLHICGVNKEFKGLTIIENIHIYEL